jgi:hypothetical protein
MKLHEINEIKACLPNSRTLFYYFKDRYALELLADAVQTPTPMRTLKQSPFAGLLRKPVVQEAVSSCANGLISPAPLQAQWPSDPHAFVLSLGQWGHKKASDYYQTSRSGHNLVLHLNFSNHHDTAYRKALSTPSYSPFTCSSHPNDTRGRNTLAWARLDIDLQRGEALIEEVQNDWLREARADRKALTHILKDNCAWEEASKKWLFYRECYAKVKSLKTLTEYLDECIVPYERIWDEAMLYATIWFLRKEIGIERIFYNTWTTGCRMKGIEEDFAPPRSMYTDLPRRFCFQETEEYPEMIHKRVRYIKRKWKNETPRWFELAS